MAATKLVLVRHGVTVWNEDGRMQGQLDIPLSEAGRGQARSLARALSGIPLAAAYTSDLSRAAETAALCLQGREIAARPDPRLRERHYGVWQGKLKSDVLSVTGDARQLPPGGLDAAPDGGESWGQLRSRVARALDSILLEVQGRGVLVIAHGGTLRAAFCHLLGMPGGVRRTLRVDNACICEFDVDALAASLVRWNDTHHLG